MKSVKSIKKLLTSVVLLASILSFSGFTNYPSFYQKPQTELVLSNPTFNKVTTKQFTLLSSASQKTQVNQYVLFNFKSLLQVHKFSFSITFKSQKKVQLEINNLTVLEQNLITQVFSNNPQSNVIK